MDSLLCPYTVHFLCYFFCFKISTIREYVCCVFQLSLSCASMALLFRCCSVSLCASLPSCLYFCNLLYASMPPSFVSMLYCLSVCSLPPVLFPSLVCCFAHVSAGLSLWCCASQCASLPLQWCFLAPLWLPIAHINSFASLSTYPVCFCAPSLHSFFILVTNPAKKKLKSACHFVGMCVRGAHTYKMTLPSFSEDFLNIIL